MIGSKLEKVLSKGEFALTVEVGPPRGPNPEVIRKKAEILNGLADGYNITDNQTAVVRMSSIAGAKLLLDQGLEPVMQMTCRDRNRIAMQSDILGASAMGIRNCLIISGDHQIASAGGKLKGDAGAKNVFDLDSIQALSMLRGMRDGKLVSGDELDEPAGFLIGAAWTPLAPPEDYRVIRLAKKIDAGADFIQTQAVYDIERFADSVAQAREMGLTEKAAILAGIIVPRSAGMLKYMNRNVPGVEVPDELIARMENAKDQKAEGIKITIELIEKARAIEGIKGIHLQAIAAEEMLPEIIKSAGLHPRPQV